MRNREKHFGESARHYMTLLFVCLIFVPVWFSASAHAAGNRSVLREYIDALRKHDVGAQFRFYTSDFVFINGESRTRADRQMHANYRAFEAATHTHWSYSIIHETPNSIEIQLIEDNDFYRALGVGPATMDVVYYFRGHHICASKTVSSNHVQPYQPALMAFKEWLLRERPDEANEVMKDENPIFDSHTAPTLMRLVRQWNHQPKSSAWFPRR